MIDVNVYFARLQHDALNLEAYCIPPSSISRPEERASKDLECGIADKIQARVRGIGQIGLLDMAELDEAVLDGPVDDRAVEPVQAVLAGHDGEVGQRDLSRVAGHDGRHAEVQRVDLARRDVQLVVAAVVDLLPLQLAVGAHEPLGRLHAAGDGDVGAVGRRRRDGRAAELDADGALARGRVVGVVVQPHQVRHPVGVAVARDHDVVGDVVAVQRLVRAVAVGLVPVPRVVVERVDVAVRHRLVDA